MRALSASRRAPPPWKSRSAMPCASGWTSNGATGGGASPWARSATSSSSPTRLTSPQATRISRRSPMSPRTRSSPAPTDWTPSAPSPRRRRGTWKRAAGCSSSTASARTPQYANCWRAPACKTCARGPILRGYRGFRAAGGKMAAMDIKQRIKQQVTGSPVVLYMKGTPQAPQSGFSALAVQVLNACGVREFTSVNVLADAEIRQGIKEYANWPTIPQLYINGEFVGGSDIMREMYQSGELQKLLEQAKNPAELQGTRQKA